MPTNNIGLFVVNQPSPTAIEIRWTHELQIVNENVTESERLVSLSAEIYNTNNVLLGSRNITASYRARNITLTGLPQNTNIKCKLVITTSLGTASSNFININTQAPPSAPRNVVARVISDNLGRIDVTWEVPISTGGVPLVNYFVQYSIDGGLSWYSVTMSGVQTAYSFNGLARNNAYIFRVIAENASGAKSPVSANSRPVIIQPSVSSQDNILFDKTSVQNLALPFRDYLIFAMEEWERHLRLDPEVVNLILRTDPNFRGIRIKSLDTFNQPASGGGVTVAYVDSRTVDAWNINPLDRFDPRICTTAFSVAVNTNQAVANFSAELWRSVITHEVGHGLGLGMYWQTVWLNAARKNATIGDVNANNNWYLLKGSLVDPVAGRAFFPNAQEGYNSLFDFNSPRQYIPLMWQSQYDQFNRIAHWSYARNTTNKFTRFHPPVPNDIMAYGSFVGVDSRQITPLSVGALLDLGYTRAIGAPLSPYTTSSTLNDYSTILPNSSGIIPHEESGEVGTIVGEIDLTNKTIVVYVNESED